MHFSEVLKAVKLDSVLLYNREFPPVEFSFAQFMQAGAFINQSCGHAVV